MDKKFLPELIFTRRNSSLKFSSILKYDRISRLMLGCCYTVAFTICTIDAASAESRYNPSAKDLASSPVHCHWDLQVDCLYVDTLLDPPVVYASGKGITVPGYWDRNPFSSCWPKSGTSTDMDKACAKLGDEYPDLPLFASHWPGNSDYPNGWTVTPHTCRDEGDGSGYDANNKVCVRGWYESASQSPGKRGKPLKLESVPQQERSKQGQLKQNQPKQEQIKKEEPR